MDASEGKMMLQIDLALVEPESSNQLPIALLYHYQTTN